MAGIVSSDIFPGRLQAMPRNILTIASRKRLERRKRLTPFKRNSRVINQFKQYHWDTFCRWVGKQHERKLLRLNDGDSPDNITKLNFIFQPHARRGSGDFTKSEVYEAIAELINEVGGSDGFKYNLMVFYRYISSQEHSNLHVDYKALKRQLSSMLHTNYSGEK